jgi:hypothetical protein
MVWIAHYGCFIHPREKGDSLESECPRCKEPFGLPLFKPPTAINGKPVIEPVSRGFYSAVFVTERATTGRKYAVKVTPRTTYRPPSEGGWGKNFEDQIAFHTELSDLTMVARLEDFGSEVLRFGSIDIDCYWTEMEFVDGPTLGDKLKGPPPEPREIAQIAWDLLDFLDALQRRGKYHNDLHGENIKVVRLPAQQVRREVIDPQVAVKVLDLGSGDTEPRSDSSNVGDVHWVARHILDLLDSYERNSGHVAPKDLRLCAQLRKVAEVYCADDKTRAPRASDMKALVLSAYQFGIRPLSQRLVQLGSFAEHYNAQTLPAWYTPTLLYDPESWSQRLTGPGSVLLVGMRGCGKTILLRSLEWPARVAAGDETKDQRERRLDEEPFLGIFVSCTSLLRGPHSKTVELIFHRLFLAFAREIVRDLHLCELDRLGETRYLALEPFVDFVSKIVPWVQPPDLRDLVLIERRLSEAIQEFPSTTEEVGSPRDAFEELVAVARELNSLWAEKRLLFLLDDVSTRYLPLPDVERLLSQFCLHSADFGFKISTETQTLQLTTPGGDLAREGRDYEIFDLGEEVYARLKGSQGPLFIKEILDRRSAVTVNAPDISPAELLGSRSLADIARAIRQRKPVLYNGIQALAAICIGDVSDILQVYALMLDRAGTPKKTMPAKLQHDAITDFAEQKLLALAGLDPWLFAHAIAFGLASHRELMRERPRLRQYTEIFVKIDTRYSAEVFPKLIKLVDAGVFVFTGGTTRTKSKDPALQFKLAFRKLLGLTNRMPLSSRDRFELTGAQVREWVDKPAAEKVQRGTLASPPSEVDETPVNGGSSKLIPSASQRPLWSAARTKTTASKMALPPAHSALDVITSVDSPLARSGVSLTDKTIVAAIGFEDRSVGTWKAILKHSIPERTVLLTYEDSGRKEEILTLLQAAGVPYDLVPAMRPYGSEVIDRIFDSADPRRLVLDITSMTKSLTYSGVVRCLTKLDEAWVIHTLARKYYPPEGQLLRVLELFDSGKFPAAFERLNLITAGEIEPFECGSIGPLHIDSSQPTVMATFVSLKNRRVEEILNQNPVNAVAAIAPVHTEGADAPRSAVAGRVATYLARLYDGTVHQVGSLDHGGAFELLKRLYHEFALEDGWNFEVSLTGNKLHAVGAAMFAAIAQPAAVYWSAPAGFDPNKFTKGTGDTGLLHLERVPVKS